MAKYTQSRMPKAKKSQRRHKGQYSEKTKTAGKQLEAELKILEKHGVEGASDLDATEVVAILVHEAINGNQGRKQDTGSQALALLGSEWTGPIISQIMEEDAEHWKVNAIVNKANKIISQNYPQFKLQYFD